MLEVISGNQPAHAEADNGYRLLRPKALLDFGFQAFGQWFDAAARVLRADHRLKADTAILLEFFAQAAKWPAGVDQPEAIDQYHVPGWCGFSRMESGGCQKGGTHGERKVADHDENLGLARGPVQGAPAQQVNVQMRNGFAAMRAVVDDKSIAGFINAFVARDLCGSQQQGSEHVLMLRPGRADAVDPVFRYDEDVDRCLGRDVAKRQNLIIFVDDLSRDFTVPDFLEQ